jgi:hypothetical protein
VGYFTELRWARPRAAAFDAGEMEGPLLQMPPFTTITGYRDGASALTGTQLTRVQSVADFITNSWRGTSAITSIRITGHINAREADATLGKKRADAVVGALLRAFAGTSETLASRLFWIVEDRGFADAAKVEIFLWAGPTAPPVPPLVRIPSPAETTAGRTRPETLDEKIQRILRTTLPTRSQGRSFSDVFWKRFNEKVDDAMERLRVPSGVRGSVKKGLQAAVRKGSEALLDQVLEAAELPDATRKAIKGTIQGLMQQKVR